MTIRHLLLGSIYSLACMAPADDAGHAFNDAAADGFTLADLSELDVSDIQEIRFETLPAGIYEFEVMGATLNEGTNKDGEKRFTAEFEFKIVEVKALLKPGVDKDSLVGKKITEKLWIDPKQPQDKVAEAIGRIRAFVADMGCDNLGKLGDIVANTKGHVTMGKITNKPDKDDKTRIYARVAFEPKKTK